MGIRVILKNRNYFAKALMLALFSFVVMLSYPHTADAQECYKDSSDTSIQICVAIVSVTPTKQEFSRSFTATARIYSQNLKEPAILRYVWIANPKGEGDLDSIVNNGRITITPDKTGYASVTINSTFSSNSFEADSTRNVIGIGVGLPEGQVAVVKRSIEFEKTKPGISPRVEINFDQQPSGPGLNYILSALYFAPQTIAPSQDPNYNIAWDFGDSITGEGYSLSHAFPSAGTYLVKTQVKTGDAVVAENSMAIEVSGIPPAEFAGEVKGVFSFADGIGAILLVILNVVVGVIALIFNGLFLVVFSWLILPLFNALLGVRAADIVTIVNIGWETVRNIANMFFILALIYIGVVTILRLGSGDYKKLIGWLILMALLVNFSLVIGRIVIQIADVATFNFLGNSNAIAQSLYDKVKGLVDIDLGANLAAMAGAFGTSSATASQFNVTINIIFKVIMQAVTLIVFGAIVAFLFIRVVALWLLLILSPMAYALSAIPRFRNMLSSWWTQFMRYAFFTPIIAFFIYIVLEIGDSGALDGFLKVGSGASDPSFKTNVQAIMASLVVLALLAFSLKVANRLSIHGAGAVVGRVQGAVRGGYKYTGKKLDNYATKGVEPGSSRFRRGLSYLSPTALKQGVKATFERREVEAKKSADLAAARIQTAATKVHPFATKQEKAVDHKLKNWQARVNKAETEIDTNDADVLAAKRNHHIQEKEYDSAQAVDLRLMKNGDFDKVMKATGNTQDVQGMQNLLKTAYAPIGKEAGMAFAGELQKVAKETKQVQYMNAYEGSYDPNTRKTAYSERTATDAQNKTTAAISRMTPSEISQINSGSLQHDWVRKAIISSLPNDFRAINNLSQNTVANLLLRDFDKLLKQDKEKSLKMLNRMASWDNSRIESVADRIDDTHSLPHQTAGFANDFKQYASDIITALHATGRITTEEIDDNAEDLRTNGWRVP